LIFCTIIVGDKDDHYA